MMRLIAEWLTRADLSARPIVLLFRFRGIDAVKADLELCAFPRFDGNAVAVGDLRHQPLDNPEGLPGVRLGGGGQQQEEEKRNKKKDS